MVNIKKFSISKIIENNPIISSIAFIILFEMFLEAHAKFLLWGIVIYLILKVLGINDKIKNILNKIYGKAIIIADNNFVDILEVNDNGEIVGEFGFKRGIDKYLLKVTEVKPNISMKLYRYRSGSGTEKILEVTSEYFEINRETAIQKIDSIYFKQPKDSSL